MPAPARAVEVTHYYDWRTGRVVLCSVATRNTDGSRTWYVNVKDEVEGRCRAEQVKVMLDMDETAPVTVHERPAVTTDNQYLSDELASEPVRPRETLERGFRRNAEALDRLLAFGDLIDANSLTDDERETLSIAAINGDVALANESNSLSLWRLTESGRRFISKFSPVGR